MLRYPSLRAPLDILFLVCCIALTADVLVPEIWGNGKTKDYPLWFWAGQQVLAGKDLYPSNPNSYFDFIYPPLSAVLLAVPSYFGKIPLYICLSLFNAVAASRWLARHPRPTSSPVQKTAAAPGSGPASERDGES